MMVSKKNCKVVMRIKQVISETKWVLSGNIHSIMTYVGRQFIIRCLVLNFQTAQKISEKQLFRVGRGRSLPTRLERTQVVEQGHEMMGSLKWETRGHQSQTFLAS